MSIRSILTVSAITLSLAAPAMAEDYDLTQGGLVNAKCAVTRVLRMGPAGTLAWTLASSNVYFNSDQTTYGQVSDLQVDFNYYIFSKQQWQFQVYARYQDVNLQVGSINYSPMEGNTHFYGAQPFAAATSPEGLQFGGGGYQYQPLGGGWLNIGTGLIFVKCDKISGKGVPAQLFSQGLVSREQVKAAALNASLADPAHPVHGLERAAAVTPTVETTFIKAHVKEGSSR